MKNIFFCVSILYISRCKAYCLIFTCISAMILVALIITNITASGFWYWLCNFFIAAAVANNCTVLMAVLVRRKSLNGQ